MAYYVTCFTSKTDRPQVFILSGATRCVGLILTCGVITFRIALLIVAASLFSNDASALELRDNIGRVNGTIGFPSGLGLNASWTRPKNHFTTEVNFESWVVMSSASVRVGAAFEIPWRKSRTSTTIRPMIGVRGTLFMLDGAMVSPETILSFDTTIWASDEVGVNLLASGGATYFFDSYGPGSVYVLPVPVLNVGLGVAF